MKVVFADGESCTLSADVSATLRVMPLLTELCMVCCMLLALLTALVACLLSI